MLDWSSHDSCFLVIIYEFMEIHGMQAAAGEANQILMTEGHDGLDFLIQDAGTSEDLVPPLKT